ncbi:hypothetical protein VDG1235_4540 [Verrucomicrobiia bacterium DG1235]|nr:hypothetical protein VDG1235_4540 [Verrucomicrobiae bacterium DG1235]
MAAVFLWKEVALGAGSRQSVFSFMIRFSLQCIALLAFCLSACSPAPDYRVAGSVWLSSEKGGTKYDVLAYPLVEDELAYLESVFPALELAATKYPDLWAGISKADDPRDAARQNAFWNEAGVLGADLIAINLKLTFLSEFGSTDEADERQLRTNLAWLEERMKGENAKPELWDSANSIRAILGVIEAHQDSGAFVFYANRKARVDAALDRFTGIGEQ